MGRLTPLKNEQAYLKCGFLGDTATGKTLTGFLLSLGLWKYFNLKLPIAIFDADGGASFLEQIAEIEGVPVLVDRSKAFADMMSTAREAEQTCSILLIDGITSVFDELKAAYLASLGKSKFNPLKDTQHVRSLWQPFSDWFKQSRIHCIACARPAPVMVEEEDDQGDTKLVKKDVKMKGDKEFGHEPSLLIEMELAVTRKTSGKDVLIHQAFIKKDRFMKINGQLIEFPEVEGGYQKGYCMSVFNAFFPAIEPLQIGAEHKSVDATRSSVEMLKPGSPTNYLERKRRANVAVEEVEAALTVLWPSTSAAEKQARGDAAQVLFGTRSKTAIENLEPEVLEAAVATLRRFEAKYRGKQFDSYQQVIEAIQSCKASDDLPFADDELPPGMKK